MVPFLGINHYGVIILLKFESKIETKIYPVDEIFSVKSFMKNY